MHADGTHERLRKRPRLTQDGTHFAVVVTDDGVLRIVQCCALVPTLLQRLCELIGLELSEDDLSDVMQQARHEEVRGLDLRDAHVARQRAGQDGGRQGVKEEVVHVEAGIILSRE